MVCVGWVRQNSGKVEGGLSGKGRVVTENVRHEPGETPLPRPLTDRVAALRAAVQGVAEPNPRDLEGATAAIVLHELRALTGRIDAVATTVLPVVESDGLWALEGWRTFASWLAMTERISVGTAKKQIRRGRVLRHRAEAASVWTWSPDR